MNDDGGANVLIQLYQSRLLTFVTVRLTLSGRMEDPRIRQLRDLCDQAIKLKEAAEQLVAELNEQLQRSISTHDDRGAPPERRRNPRS